MNFQVGDIVRRKHDHSGRTRIVAEIYSIGEAQQLVVLNKDLDGWRVWGSDQLRRVKRQVDTRAVRARPVSGKRQQ